ncbi:hypothetical protein B4U80_10956, partial [Leptotrombidium deliense]
LAIKIIKRKEVNSISAAMKDIKITKDKQTNRRKTTLTLSLITGAFIACWLPFFIIVAFLPEKIEAPFTIAMHWIVRCLVCGERENTLCTIVNDHKRYSHSIVGPMDTSIANI